MMPQFYFHTRDSQFTMPDPEGVELPDLTAAIAEAKAAARELIGIELQSDHSPAERWFDIADTAGQVLATVPFREAL